MEEKPIDELKIAPSYLLKKYPPEERLARRFVVSKLDAIGKTRTICPTCLQELCSCTSSRTERYTALILNHPDGNAIRAILPSPSFNPIAGSIKALKPYSSLGQFIPTDPNMHLSESYYYRNDHELYNNDSVTSLIPYFREGKLSVLTCIYKPPYDLKDPRLNNNYSLPYWELRLSLYPIQACSLSSDNTYQQQNTYFKYGTETYPLSFLTMLPDMLKSCITAIAENQCEVTKDKKSVTFSFPDNIISQYTNSSPTVFQNILEDIMSETYYPKQYINSTSDIPYGAFVAKNCGNPLLAYHYMDQYDKSQKQYFSNSDNTLYITRLGNIDGEIKRKTDYVKRRNPRDIIQSLNIMHDIDELLIDISNNPTSLMSDSANHYNYIEVQKNNVNFEIFPWKNKRKEVACPSWARGKLHRLINCRGKISKITSQKGKGTNKIQSIQVTVLYEDSSTKQYTLHANQTIDVQTVDAAEKPSHLMDTPLIDTQQTKNALDDKSRIRTNRIDQPTITEQSTSRTNAINNQPQSFHSLWNTIFGNSFTYSRTFAHPLYTYPKNMLFNLVGRIHNGFKRFC